ncbi:MAG TPA: carboxypeptidase-like regulatory domain-containing protein [Acidobacteriaceae bacterium]|nr:carboxypeptidase-like regulatory domain-containing protein [Acidobacteriaceae bacterium]
MIRSGILAVAVALGALASAAQNGPGSFTISGVVRSATSGAPLDRAEVTLSTAGEQETQIAETITGERGAFRFEALAAGKYVLAASRRGYISARYQEHEGGYSTAIVTGPDLVSESLRFNLFPTAVIGGVVSDDNGDPVGGAQVTLYRRQQQGGETKIVSADADSTEEDGSYEFDRLHAGAYYIGVSATPWYAFRPPQRVAPDGTLLSADQQPRSPLDVAYPMTFYADATDSSSATPIQINPGDHPQLNLTLHAVPAVRIEVHAPKPDMKHGFAIPQLSEDVFGSEEYQAPVQVSERDVGDQVVIDLGSVAPGHYVLHDFIVNGVNRRASISLTADQSIDFTEPGNAIDLSGRLEMSSGAALAPVTMLQLVPAGGGGGTVSAPASADGSFDLHAVAPGEYTVQVTTSTGILDIVQMAASGAEVHGHRITIGSDSVLLAAMVSRGSVSVTGFARREGKGIGGALVLLVPEHPQDNDDLFRLDQSDSDGSFSLGRVLPGNYTLVAIENGWTLEWSRPEVIAPYLARGVKIHINEQQTSVELPSPVEVQ